MAEPDPIAHAARTADRVRKLVVVRCLVCGQKNPEALTRCKRSLLERHHVANRANDRDLMVTLCMNCHRLATWHALAMGVPTAPPETPEARVAAFLLGVGVFLVDLGRRCLAASRDLTREDA